MVLDPVHALAKPTLSFSMTAMATSLARCGAVGKACKLAFSYGTKSNPEVAATFLAKITRPTLHEHVPAFPSEYKTAKITIPIKAITDAFT